MPQFNHSQMLATYSAWGMVMAIKQIHDERMRMLVCSVRKDLLTGSGAVINDLTAAVDVILSSLDDDEIFFRAIDVSGRWSPQHGEFKPWENPNRQAWERIIAQTALHDQLWDWLTGLETVLARHLEERYEGLHDSEETQLGEVPASLLAIRTLRFVPMFTRLLSAWDLDHGVYQNDVCVQIVKTHGRTPEVEELLFALATKHFYTDAFEELRETLASQYGDFTESDLFRRIVIKGNLSSADQPFVTHKSLVFSHCPKWPELKEAEMRILAERDVT